MTGDCEDAFMCGRFTVVVKPGELAEVLGVESIPDVRKRYNVAHVVGVGCPRRQRRNARSVLHGP